jgi:hypothetical protein
MPRLRQTGPPLTPCDRLILAQLQLDAILSGKALRSVETPQLGKVEFAAISTNDLQRLVAMLQRQCDLYNGVTPVPRGPISVEVCP